MDENNKKTGMKPEFLMYNVMGYRPVEVKFQLDMETVRKMIMDIASREISGIDSITWERDEKKGIVRWFIWFDSNSNLFKDASTENSMLGTRIDRNSKEFEEFARKFGWRPSDEGDGSNKVNINQIKKQNINREISRRLTGVQVSINSFIKVAFDYDGLGFKSEYGVNIPKTKFSARYIFEKGPSGPYHNVLGMRVTKSLAYMMDSREKPKAKWSGKFN